MTPKEALAVLVAAFRQEKIELPTIRLYEQKLRDIPGPLLAAAVNRVIDGSRFFPSVAELKETAAALAGVLPPSAEEAAEIIRRADVAEPVYRRDGTLAYVERYWVWPTDVPAETISCIRATLRKVGEPFDREGKPVFAWEAGFRKVYEAVAAEVTQAALTDLSRAPLPAASRKALTEAVQVRLPEPRLGGYACGFDPELGGRHRPDCPTCAAAASGPPATPEPEPLLESADIAENLHKVQALIGDLAREKAAQLREEIAAERKTPAPVGGTDGQTGLELALSAPDVEGAEDRRSRT